MESATRLGLDKDAISAIKALSNGAGEVLLGDGRLTCDVRAVLNNRWKRGYWESFREFFPGGLASVSISSVALSKARNKAYVYSHTQWGPLQGESNLWILVRDEKSGWQVANMYAISRS